MIPNHQSPRRLAVIVGVIVVAFALWSITTMARGPVLSRPWWTEPATIQRGARDFATGSCISCHSLAGVSTASAAIDLTHEGRRRSVRWLLHELAHPTSPRPPLPPGQLHDLAAYLTSLR